MRGDAWSFEETLVAFELYSRTPYAKISKFNEDIIELAGLLGRTPSSVSMKLANISRNDPEELARGVVGLRNGAKLELVVWDRFNENAEETMYMAHMLLESLKRGYGLDVASYLEQVAPMGQKEQAADKRRVGQVFFRNAVLSAYDNRCCISGMVVPELLVARHIKPWKVSSSQERLDPHNGLCLNGLYDMAFVKGYITVNNDFEVVVASGLKNDLALDDYTKKEIVQCEGIKLFSPKKFRPGNVYLEYHRDMVFLG